MRRVSIPRPFAGGYRSDVPDYALEDSQTAFAQDVVAPRGIAHQRWGWEYRGTSPVVSSPHYLTGVCRTRYPITERNRTVVCSDNGKVYVTDQDGAQILLWNDPDSSGTYFIPRCIYNGDLIICAQDGETPLLRYAGSLLPYETTYNGLIRKTGGGLTFTLAGGGQTITTNVTPTSPSGIDKGSFITFYPFDTSGNLSMNPFISSHVIETDGSSSFSLEVVRNVGTSSATSSSTALHALPVGFTWPAVSVYETGKLTSVSGTPPAATATFQGTDFTSSGANVHVSHVGGDALLAINPADPPQPHQISHINNLTSSTSLGISSTINVSNAAYKILRRCPFKDAAVHRGSLWGTGVRQYPSRVYVFGPTDDIGIPPGSAKPYDTTKQAGYANATVTGFTRVNDFLCGAYDVPGPYDTSPNIAILPSSGPLLVLKADSVYGIFGTYDQSNAAACEVTRIADNSGCIDLRSAVTSGSIPYWAGEDGIFTYQNGMISSLTDGKISREWQVLMRAYIPGTSWVASGSVGSYLVVSCGGLDDTRTADAKIGTDTANPTGRTFVYDTRANVWLGRVTNFNPRHMWAVEFNNIPASLYSADDNSTGRVIDAAPAFINGANPIDANNLGPRMKAWSRSSLAQADGVEGETKFCDALIHTNLYDATTPTSQIDVSVVSGGSTNEKPSATKALSSIYADATDRVDRNKRIVNRSGRLHQIRVDMSVTDSSNEKSEIPEVMMSFRDSRRGT